MFVLATVYKALSVVATSATIYFFAFPNLRRKLKKILSRIVYPKKMPEGEIALEKK